jgi:Lrp/AsnC family leucine-responsive transcriptional regulator
MERTKITDRAIERRIPRLETLGIDRTDLILLKHLQRQGRTKRNELAEEVGLSLPAVSERMRKLEERGILESIQAKLDPKLVGLDVAAFIFVTVESSSNYAHFLDAAAQHPEVLEVHAITGDGSHLLKIRTWNTSTLERLLSEIQSWPGVRGTRTNVVLSSHKETMALPLEEFEITVQAHHPSNPQTSL